METDFIPNCIGISYRHMKNLEIVYEHCSIFSQRIIEFKLFGLQIIRQRNLPQMIYMQILPVRFFSSFSKQAQRTEICFS